MATRKGILACDLFCGAGGSSTGLSRACAALSRKLKLRAINHWDLAVEQKIGHRFRLELSLAEVQEALDKGEAPAADDGKWNM